MVRGVGIGASSYRAAQDMEAASHGIVVVGPNDFAAAVAGCMIPVAGMEVDTFQGIEGAVVRTVHGWSIRAYCARMVLVGSDPFGNSYSSAPTEARLAQDHDGLIELIERGAGKLLLDPLPSVLRMVGEGKMHSVA